MHKKFQLCKLKKFWRLCNDTMAAGMQPRIRSEKDTTSVPTPGITWTNRIQRPRNPDQLVAPVPFGLSRCPKKTLGSNSAASHTKPRGSSTPRLSNTPRIIGSQHPRIPGACLHQDLRVPEAAWLTGTLTYPGDQDHRIPKSQDPRESWILRSSDTTRNTGRTNSSQIY